MKNLIINNCLNYISKYNNYSNEKMKEIEYGLVSIYLTISKLIVISIIAIILGIFKEMLIFTLIFNVIRMPAFGLHATKSWICLISSTIMFIGLPYLSINLNISIYIKSIMCCVGIIFMFKNAPADTHKRPIVNKKRRLVYKTLSTVLAITYAFIAILIKEQFISNCLVFSIILQNCLISPSVYKLFKLPYNNYIAYIKLHPELAQ